MSNLGKKTRKSLIKRLQSAFSDLEKCEELDLKTSYKLGSKKVRVPLKHCPIQVNIGEPDNVLHLYPEQLLADDKGKPPSSDHYILVNPDHYFSKVSGFYRLDDGDKLTLGRSVDGSEPFLKLSPELSTKALSISNEEGSLLFKVRDKEVLTCISPLIDKKSHGRLREWRIDKLKRVKAIYGGEIQALAAEEALKVISDVNRIMADESYRVRRKGDGPGGLLEIPASLTPIIIGDLHTSIDNLLTLLSRNYFLEALEEGSASLIILGDAVHPDQDGDLAEMKSSMLIMDLIFKLKLRFPDGVFYLRGNHDSFGSEIAKGGVPQGVLWEQELVKRRGKEYLRAMKRYYELLPYVACSESFIACHAGPPTSPVDKSQLVNIQKQPQLIRELINNRLQSSTRVAGYNKSHLKKFRKALGLSLETPVVVGHTPISDDETIWENPNQIDNHIVVYGSDAKWIGAMVGIEGRLFPIRYPAEKLTGFINAL